MKEGFVKQLTRFDNKEELINYLEEKEIEFEINEVDPEVDKIEWINIKNIGYMQKENGMYYAYSWLQESYQRKFFKQVGIVR